MCQKMPPNTLLCLTWSEPGVNLDCLAVQPPGLHLAWTLPGLYLECLVVTWTLPGLHQDMWLSVKYWMTTSIISHTIDDHINHFPHLWCTSESVSTPLTIILTPLMTTSINSHAIDAPHNQFPHH